MSETQADGDETDEYRPIDWLAQHGTSYGVAGGKREALAHCLRYAGPWGEDRDEPIEVVVWELYADSWQRHGLTGPERSAEQISFRKLEIPVEEANEVCDKASLAFRATDRAIDLAEETEHVEGVDDQ